MTQAELQQKLNELIAGWENEVVEFKEANDNFSTSDIGKYFSALSNEANLKNKDAGWLVFGVRNRTRTVVGTTYREDRERLQSIKKQIGDGTDPNTTFREVYEFTSTGMRVVMFQIPPAPRGIPIAWNRHYYARHNESTSGLDMAKLDEIRSQVAGFDWSAVVVPEASINDLDPAALAKAREVFATRYADRFPVGAVQTWNDETFLDQARLTINGCITRTTLLLLGKHTSTHFINPAVAELTWKLEGPELAYEHYGPPFLLTTSQLFGRIRNINLKFYPQGELLPKEMLKYDQRIVLEALHNCIAHQDYGRNERILVIERPDELIFQNAGGFYDGSSDDYLLRHKTPSRYRNRFLAQAMVQLRMVDTMGFGIREVMFRGQADSYRPLPFYEKEGPEHVVLHLPGRIIDENYSRLLLANPDLQLADIIALDRIQKHLSVPTPVLKTLRKRGWIEGHKPNIHISAAVASTTGQKASYIRTRKQDDDYYKKLVLDFLEEWVEGTPKDMRDLLLPKLSDGLTDAQKRHKVRNLLTAMRKDKQIVAVGVKQAARWRLPFGYGPAPAKPQANEN
jgi:ATP-dependent DNA helicase RecG